MVLLLINYNHGILETEKEDKDVKEKYSNNPPDIYGFGHKTYYENVIKIYQIMIRI